MVSGDLFRLSFTSITLPEAGAKSSETAFTDSTVPKLLPACSCAPALGSSTKTISPNDCCAWSVMPTKPVLPAILIHSCSLVYLQSFGIAIGSTCPCWELRFFRALVKRGRHYLAFDLLSADIDEQLMVDFRICRRHIRQRNVLLQERRGRSAGNVAEFASGLVKYFVSIARDAAVHRFQTNQNALQSRGLNFFQGGAADEIAFVHFAIAVQGCFI